MPAATFDKNTESPAVTTAGASNSSLSQMQVNFSSSADIRDELFRQPAPVARPATQAELANNTQNKESTGPEQRLNILENLESTLDDQQVAIKGTEKQLASLLKESPGSKSAAELVETRTQEEQYLLDQQQANVSAIKAAGEAATVIHNKLFILESKGTPATDPEIIRCNKAFRLLEYPALLTSTEMQSDYVGQIELIQTKSQALILLSDPEKAATILQTMPKEQKLAVLQEALKLFEAHSEFQTYDAALKITSELKAMQPEIGISFGPTRSALLAQADKAIFNLANSPGTPVTDARGMLRLLDEHYDRGPEIFSGIADNRALAPDVRAGAACLAESDRLYVLDELYASGKLSKSTGVDAVRYLLVNRYEPFISRLESEPQTSYSITVGLTLLSRQDPHRAQTLLGNFLKTGADLPTEFWLMADKTIIQNLGKQALEQCVKAAMSESAPQMPAFVMLARLAPEKAAPVAKDLIINHTADSDRPIFAAMEVIFKQEGGEKLLELLNNVAEPRRREELKLWMGIIEKNQREEAKKGQDPAGASAQQMQTGSSMFSMPSSDPKLESLLAQLRTDQSKFIASFLKPGSLPETMREVEERDLKAQALAAHGSKESLEALATAWRDDPRSTGLALQEVPGSLEKFIDVLDDMPKDKGYAPKLHAAALKTAKSLGIEYPLRFSCDTLVEIEKNRSSGASIDDRPVAAVILPKTDWNGAFYQMDECIQDLIKHNYRVMVYEAGTDTAVIQGLRSSMDATGKKASLIILGAHGTRDAMSFGGKDPGNNEVSRSPLTLDLGDIDRLAAEASQALEKNGQVILVSCSTGAGQSNQENMANAIRRAFPQAAPQGVSAPRFPSHIKQIEMDGGGKIKSVNFYGPAYHAAVSGSEPGAA